MLYLFPAGTTVALASLFALACLLCFCLVDEAKVGRTFLVRAFVASGLKIANIRLSLSVCLGRNDGELMTKRA